jgi:predicted MFS family arabinose efflux permease
VATYGAALVAGLAVVSFPASATVLKAAHGLSDSSYGAIFLPQVVLTILGSLAGGALSERRSLGFVLGLSLVAFAVAEVALFGTSTTNADAAYLLLLAGTGSAGVGFGLSAAPLNTLPGLLFPARKETALVALHTFLGAGFATGPILIGRFVARGQWAVAPLVLGVGALASLTLVIVCRLPSRTTTSVRGAASRVRVQELVPFFFIAVLYAFAEGTFANWSTVFLHEERGVGEAEAGIALACFWAALAVGRLVVSALLIRIPSRRVWLGLPLVMAVAAVVIPLSHGAVSGIIAFCIAGFGCSAFFPLTVHSAVATDPPRGEWISSAMTAALMLGVGLGSFTVGPLRSVCSIGQIYLLSALYPLSALALAFCAPTSGAPSHGSAQPAP